MVMLRSKFVLDINLVLVPNIVPNASESASTLQRIRPDWMPPRPRSFEHLEDGFGQGPMMHRDI